MPGPRKHNVQVLLAAAAAAVAIAHPPAAWAQQAGRALATEAAGARAPAARSQRIALVIGNNAYRDAPLANPVNDARAMAAVLREAGFDVILRTDADKLGMLNAVRDFGNRLRDGGGTGVFYFAGHGMQIKGRNYLVPVGTDIHAEDEVPYQSMDAQAVLDKMEAAGNGANLLILDACRNNPFLRRFRSGSQGLAPMDAPVGTLVAFSTAPGAVASDGAGSNGLYTHHLLQALRMPGLKIEEVFKTVRTAVRRESNGRQVPWESTSLEGDFYFFEAPVVERPAFDPQIALDDAFWQAVKDSDLAAELGSYLRRFPNGRHAQEARARMATLAAPPAAQVVTPVVMPAVAPAATPAVGGAVTVPVAAPAQAAAAPAVPGASLSSVARPAAGVGAGPAPASAAPSAALAAVALPALGPGQATAAKAPDTAAALSPREAQEAVAALYASGRQRWSEPIGAVLRPSSVPGSELAELQRWGAADTERRPAQPRRNAFGLSEGDRFRWQIFDRRRGEVVGTYFQRIDAIRADGTLDVNDGAERFDAAGLPIFSNQVASGSWDEWTRPLPIVTAGLQVGDRRPVEGLRTARDPSGLTTSLAVKGEVRVVAAERVRVPAGEFDTLRLEIVYEGRREGSDGSRRFVQTRRVLWYAPGPAVAVAVDLTERVDGVLDQRVRHELIALDLASLASPPASAAQR